MINLSKVIYLFIYLSIYLLILLSFYIFLYIFLVSRSMNGGQMHVRHEVTPDGGQGGQKEDCPA